MLFGATFEVSMAELVIFSTGESNLKTLALSKFSEDCGATSTFLFSQMTADGLGRFGTLKFSSSQSMFILNPCNYRIEAAYLSF